VTGETPPEATERVAEEELRPATAFGVSASLSAVLDDALQIRLEARPQTVSSFQDRLLGWDGAGVPGSENPECDGNGFHMLTVGSTWIPRHPVVVKS